MITPRRTRLIRAADLHAYRRIVETVAAGDRTAVIVPNRAAAQQLQRTIAGCLALTRDELYQELHSRLSEAPRRLSPLDREAIAQAAAADASRSVPDLPFQIRPSLVAEMLRFYDQLRRQSQTVRRFGELIEQALQVDADDRGTERMLRQTRFIEHTMSGYERRVAASGAIDEHLLRDRLLEVPQQRPLRHVVVTVADWIADPDGLFLADFDLLSRLPDLDTIDVVCTEAILASGFHQRLRDWLPGLEEIDGTAVVRDLPVLRPVLLVPAGAPPDRCWFLRRDREEELVAVARRLRARADAALHESAAERSGRDERQPVGSADAAGRQLRFDLEPEVTTDSRTAIPPVRAAVVYKRPLPYLYLAAATFGAASVRFQTADALPLAAEPTAAALDLMLDAVETDFSRESLVALLRSPHFRTDAEIPPAEICELDRHLSEQRYLGDRIVLQSLIARWETDAPRLAADAALTIAGELAALAESGPASGTIRRLSSLLTRFWRPLEPADPFASRERRARSAIHEALDGMAVAHARHHDPEWMFSDLAAAVRRSIQDTTFAADDREGPASADETAEVVLLDDQAARYGTFGHLEIVGLIEADWPERPTRNIFYPAALLKALGWPSEKERRAAADARFVDLIGSAARSVAVSTVTLENEALVARSVQLEEIPRARLEAVVDAAGDDDVFPEDCLTQDPPAIDRLSGEALDWARLRASRPSFDRPEFHGVSGATSRPGWSVSAIETYLDCPFKFFARHVLSLDEEPEDEEVIDPRRQGQFVHAVFEEFFRVWQASGRRAITADTLNDARGMFEAVVDRQLAASQLSDAEAALERTRLLGSPAASGLGEAVFRMEAERPTPVVERLLEYGVGGDLEVATPSGAQTVRLRGKADRIDLLEDGTFRLIDYKLGWPPDRNRALQLPLYGRFAERQLRDHRGRHFVLGEAAYLAFKGPRRVVPLFTSASQRDEVMAKALDRVGAALDRISRGEFPPSPDDVYRCETCAFAAVCRKDYVDS